MNAYGITAGITILKNYKIRMQNLNVKTLSWRETTSSRSQQNVYIFYICRDSYTHHEGDGIHPHPDHTEISDAGSIGLRLLC